MPHLLQRGPVRTSAGGGLLLFVFCAAALPLPVTSQQAPVRTIDGRVTDSAGTPVAYVNLRAGNARAVSNDSGRFLLGLTSPNAVKLEIRRLGFAPATLSLPAGGDTSLTITLTPVAQALRATVVQEERLRTLERRGFYSRMLDSEKGINTGYFITPEDIERRQPPLTTMLLDGLPGIRVTRSGRCNFIQRCYTPTGSNGCSFTIFVDGIRITSLSGPQSTARGDFLDELIAPSSIAGFELYTRGVRSPPEFQLLNGTCGVLVIWTK